MGINLRTKTSGIPLHCAFKNGCRDLVKFLIKEGADAASVSTDGSKMIHMAAQGGNLENITLALERGANIHVKDNMDRTPLQGSIRSRVPEAVQYLLDRGASTEDSLKTGQTAILFAI